ncbi:MAG: hypothetical protein FWC11_01375 [Firmicutes bacterium]|nr:hypothetical protein [Bacillota bacterium]MCL2255492.1 hypothetical protein [Bacillota bacterium]
MGKKDKRNKNNLPQIAPEQNSGMPPPHHHGGGMMTHASYQSQSAVYPAPGPLPNLTSLSPEQMNVVQLEEALKESQNPSMRLRRLRHPINVRSCLLSVLFIVLAVAGVTLFIIWLMVDVFDFGYVWFDATYDLGIRAFFRSFASWITGNGWNGWRETTDVGNGDYYETFASLVNRVRSIF